MIKLFTLFFFSSSFSSGAFPLVSVEKRTKVAACFGLCYLYYNYGPKTVAKKLPFILPLSGMLAGLKNENKKCTLISTVGFALSIFSYLTYTYRKFLTSQKALPLYSILLGVSAGIINDNKKFILNSLGISLIYYSYYFRHILFTKKRLFQFLFCILCIGQGYKFFTKNDLLQIIMKNDIIRKFLEEISHFMLNVELSSFFFSLVIYDAIKNFLKKNNFFNNMPCPLLLSIMGYLIILIFVQKIFSPSWNLIKRPHWYDDAVSLKIQQTKCFYNPNEGKDYTATLCGRLEAQRVFNPNQIDYNSIKNIIGMIIMTLSSKKQSNEYNEENKIIIDNDFTNLFNKLKNFIKQIFKEKENLASDTDWYWNEYDVQFSKERFQKIATLYFDAQLNQQNRDNHLFDIDSEKFAQEILSTDQDLIEQQIKEWATKEVIPGRVFDKEVSFEKVLELIFYMFKNKKYNKNDFSYIFSKDIDMRWKVVLNKMELNDDNLRYIAIHFLYGIFCDTCLINFNKNVKILKSVKKWCSGCENHANKGFMFGPMTILEHIILSVRNIIFNGGEDFINYDSMKDLGDKLIELGIVKRSFFASIKL